MRALLQCASHAQVTINDGTTGTFDGMIAGDPARSIDRGLVIFSGRGPTTAKPKRKKLWRKIFQTAHLRRRCRQDQPVPFGHRRQRLDRVAVHPLRRLQARQPPELHGRRRPRPRPHPLPALRRARASGRRDGRRRGIRRRHERVARQRRPLHRLARHRRPLASARALRPAPIHPTSMRPAQRTQG